MIKMTEDQNQNWFPVGTYIVSKADSRIFNF